MSSSLRTSITAPPFTFGGMSAEFYTQFHLVIRYQFINPFITKSYQKCTFHSHPRHPFFLHLSVLALVNIVLSFFEFAMRHRASNRNMSEICLLMQNFNEKESWNNQVKVFLSKLLPQQCQL